MADDKVGLHKGYEHWVSPAPLNEDWDKDLEFVLIRTLDDLRVHDVEHKFVAWDTETSGLNPEMDWIVGFSFSFDGKTGYYVPVKHDDIALGKEALDIFYSILKKAGTQLLYNCRFDQRFMEYAGYNLEGLPYYDAMNAIWLADTNMVLPSLKASERHYMGWTPKTFSETLGDATTFQHVPAEDAYKYACTDAIGTYKIAMISNRYYVENKPASKYDNDMLYPLMRLENTPQRLDTEYLLSLRPQVDETIERTKAEVYRLAGQEFNLNSPQQFGKILVERFAVDTGARTATGAMKADLKTVDAWLTKHSATVAQDVKDFLKAYKEYKKTVKFKSAYLEKYIKAAQEQDKFPVRFSYKVQSVPCLTDRNTVLVKDRGLCSIGDVKADDLIWTAWGYKRVLWNNSHIVDGVYRVCLENGMYIEGTGHHPVLVRTSPLDKVDPRGMTTNDVEWAGIADLKVGEPVITNHTSSALLCEDKNRCSLARVLGYFFGNGYITDSNSMCLFFDDIQMSVFYRDLLYFVFGGMNVSYKDIDIHHVEYYVSKKNVQKAAHEWSCVKDIALGMAHSPETFRHFLVGYLDSLQCENHGTGVKGDMSCHVAGNEVTLNIPKHDGDIVVPILWACAIPCDVSVTDKTLHIRVCEPYALSNLLSLWDSYDAGLAWFKSISIPESFRLYSESCVKSVEYIEEPLVVYDIEVEDVHEYVANGIVTHNTGRLSCLSRDALVHTRQGLVPLVDITEEHDIEVSPNKFAKAKLVHTGEQDFVKIVMLSGKEIECTTDHRFLCPSDEGFVWRYARDLKVSDMLCRTPVTFTGCDINFEMFVYGFFLGDGSYYSDESKNKYSLRMFFCEKDHDAMMYIHDGLVVRGIPHSMRPCKDSLWVIEFAKEGSRRLSEMFPVENVKQSERRVDFSYIHSKVDAFSVLAGVYQAEGEKYIRPYDGKMNSSLNVTSYALVQSLQRLADYVGIRTKIHAIKIDQVKHPTHNKQWRLQFCVKSFRKYLDNSISFRINTKKDVPKFLTDSLNNLPKDVWKVGERAKFKAMYHNKRYSLYSVMRLCEDSELPIEVFDYEQVVSIEPCGKKEAYTLAVDDPLHRYIAEGFIHHNCGADAKNSFFTKNNVQCLEENTEVLTSEGIKPIKDIVTGELVWSGSAFVPCVQLGSKQKRCETIWTYFGKITASLEHKFYTLNLLTFELEWECLGNAISCGKPLVRNTDDGGFTFRELLENEMFKKSMLLKPELSEERIKELEETYEDVRFDMIRKADNFWYPNIIPPEVTVYDLCVPTYERFTANGFIVHNSTPKPHAIMLKGRKATEQEIAEKKDILGWYFSNDIPDEEAKGLVEGMEPGNLNIRRAFLPENDQCYVVSIDMAAEELRIVANLCHEDTWINAFNSGADVHKACYSPDTEFMTERGWLTADKITPDMKIAYYDDKTDSVKFTRADKRCTNDATEVYSREDTFDVTDNHRMYVKCANEESYGIVLAKDLKSKGNPRQRFTMKVSMGNPIDFGYVMKSILDPIFFMSGFVIATKHEIKDDRLHITLGRPCLSMPYSVLSMVEGSNIRTTSLTLTKEATHLLSVNGFLRSSENLLSHVVEMFSQDSGTEKKDFMQQRVCGFVYGLASREDSEIYIGNEDNIHGRVYIEDKSLADVIQWALTLNGISCHCVYGIHKKKYILHVKTLRDNAIGMSYHSVKKQNVAGKNLVYSCFTVPSGLLVTRYHGRITVNGNTAIKLFGEENYSKDARKKAKCVAGDTILHTVDGHTIAIRDLVSDETRKNAVIGEPVELPESKTRISTPEGWSPVTHWISNGKKDTLKLIIERQLTLEVTPDHLVGKYDPDASDDLSKKYRLVRADSLSVGDRVLWDYCPMRITDIQKGSSDVYDITVDNASHTFHANGVVVHNCASFGILYGSGAQGFNNSFPDMTLDECREFMTKFKAALPNITSGQQAYVEHAKIYGCVPTAFGRMRRVRWFLQSGDRAKVAFGERTVKNCYSPDTEFLTKDGWKLAKDILPDTQLAYYVPEKKVILYTNAGERYTHRCTESVVYHSVSGAWNVTTNHRMWVSKNGNDFESVVADKLCDMDKFTVITSSFMDDENAKHKHDETAFTIDGKSFTFDDMAFLLGVCIRRGVITYENGGGSRDGVLTVTCDASQIPVRDRLKNTFGDLITETKRLQAGKYLKLIRFGVSLRDYVKENIGKTRKAFHVPEWVYDSDTLTVEAFIAGVVGQKMIEHPNDRFTFRTHSQKLADDIQRLCTMCCFFTRLMANKDANGKNAFTMHIQRMNLMIIGNRKRDEYRQRPVHKVTHEEMEYSCFEVPSHILVTRYRGFVSYHMNTTVQGTAADVLKLIFCRLWKKVFKPYPQVKFMSTIHDEVNFSIPIELAREVIPICMECMTINRSDWPVTLKCSLSVSRTDLGSLVPFTYDFEHDTYEPEWDTLDVKPKKKEEPKLVVAVPDETNQDEAEMELHFEFLTDEDMLF